MEKEYFLAQAVYQNLHDQLDDCDNPNVYCYAPRDSVHARKSMVEVHVDALDSALFEERGKFSVRFNRREDEEGKPLRPCDREVVVLGQDESIFKKHMMTGRSWFFKDVMSLRPKTEGTFGAPFCSFSPACLPLLHFVSACPSTLSVSF